MNKTKIAGIAATFAVAVIVLISAPTAKAEYPNILVSDNMTLGDRGQSVVVLQALLSEMGYLKVPMGIPLGYYGSMTKNALAAYQSRLNVSPAIGYYGPETKIAMHAELSSRGWLRILGW